MEDFNYPQFKLFSAVEEKELFRKMQDEDCMESRRLLIESQIGLARMLIGKHYLHRNNRMEFDELMSCANLACVEAVDRFDPSRGTRLSSLLSFVVRTAVGLRFTPGPFYLPYFSQYNAKYKAEAWQTVSSVRSLDSLEYEDTSLVNSQSAPTEAVDIEDELELMRVALDKMSERHRYVLKARFLDGRTLKAVGIELGLTRERVRQIEGKALEKMREILQGAT